MKYIKLRQNIDEFLIAIASEIKCRRNYITDLVGIFEYTMSSQNMIGEEKPLIYG